MRLGSALIDFTYHDHHLGTINSLQWLDLLTPLWASLNWNPAHTGHQLILKDNNIFPLCCRSYEPLVLFLTFPQIHTWYLNVLLANVGETSVHDMLHCWGQEPYRPGSKRSPGKPPRSSLELCCRRILLIGLLQ